MLHPAMESLRVRLMFEDRHILSKSQRSNGLTRSWFLLNSDHHPKFSDLSAYLLHIFDLNHSCPNGLRLSMDGFVLPPFESTRILKDKDIISVKKRGGTLSDIVKVSNNTDSAKEQEIVQKQPVHTGTLVLVNEEFGKETGGCQSESEEAEEHPDDITRLENSSGILSKKRKISRKIQSSKSKKHCLVVSDGVENDIHIEQMESCHNDGVLLRKNPCKKLKVSNAKRKLDNDSTPENAERSNRGVEPTPSEKRDQLQENDKGIEDASHACNTPRKVPSRMARRKKTKRQLLGAMAKIGKKEVVCKSKGLLNRKHRRAKPEKKEVVCQSKGPLNWKQSHKEHHERSIEPKQSSQNSDEDNDFVPITIRPGHIRFEPLEEDQVVKQSQGSVETFQWNGITSKRKGQKWGKEKNSSASKNEYQHFKDHSYTIIEQVIHVNDPIDFENLPLLSSLPKEGHVIAYRLLELSSTWTPEISSFRVGRVLWYKPESSTIMLMPVPEYPVSLEKLQEGPSELPPDDSLYEEDGSLEIDFNSLVDVRIVEQSNSDYAKAATDKVNEDPPGDKDSLSYLVSSNHHDKQKVTPHADNVEASMCDHFSEALDTKKAQPTEENNGSKGSSSRSSLSNRAWRGSALGPTIALLRAKNSI